MLRLGTLDCRQALAHGSRERAAARASLSSGYDGVMSRAAALVDEIANELSTWPGVRIERPSASTALVQYEQIELGVLDRERGVAELRFSDVERNELIEHGDAEPSDSLPESVSRDVHGPADVTAVLGLFDRRYREVRGEDGPYSTKDPA